MQWSTPALKCTEETEVKLHLFLTLMQDQRVWLAACLYCFNSAYRPWVSLDKKVNGSKDKKSPSSKLNHSCLTCHQSLCWPSYPGIQRPHTSPLVPVYNRTFSLHIHFGRPVRPDSNSCTAFLHISVQFLCQKRCAFISTSTNGQIHHHTEYCP